MRILAIDPGVTSGYVLAKVSNDDPSQTLEDRLKFKDIGEWEGMEALSNIVYLFNNVDVCVIERYAVYPNRARQHIGDDLYTARVIGRVEWLAFSVSGIKELEFQSASQAKQRWPNSRLFKHLSGLRHFSPHIRDATRHLLTYLETNG